MKRIGVDVGGTFTDLILVDEETGRIAVDKVPRPRTTRPRRRSPACAGSVRHRRRPVGDLDGILHGTTVATNIVLQRNGSRVGMITTEGFRDILHIARHKRPYNFSLYCDLPWQTIRSPSAPHRLTVGERVTAPDGRRDAAARRGGGA